MEFTQYTVAIALVRLNKMFLSQRLATKNFPLHWQFAGGKMDEGETPIVGALRELKEETALDIDASRLQYIGPITGDPTTRTCYVYRVDLNADEKPQHTEKDTMTDWELMTPDDALKLLLMPGLKNVIERLKNEN